MIVLAVTADQRFSIILVALTALMGGLGWVLRSLIGVTHQWVRTGAKLEELSNDIRDLVTSKERDHARMDARVDRLDDRVTRHEGWHSDQRTVR